MPPTTCPYCPCRPISKRIGTTDLGYGVFRCSACRRKFNELSCTPFLPLELPTDIVFQVLFCRLRYKLSFRNVAELFSAAWLRVYASGRAGVEGSLGFLISGATPSPTSGQDGSALVGG